MTQGSRDNSKEVELFVSYGCVTIGIGTEVAPGVLRET